MTMSMALTYSNWINQPALIVSIKSDDFYKNKCSVRPEFNSKFLSIVNGNTSGHGDLKTYTYKINDLLYYYQAHSSPAASERQHQADLKIFLERASREFGVVFLDLDDSIDSFKKFLDIADMCFTILPPDKMVIKTSGQAVEEVLEHYKEMGGLAVKTKMFYVLNKLDGGMNKSSFCKLLKVGQREAFTLPYDKRFILESNNNRLIQFLANTLQEQKTANDKVLQLSYKRIYDVVRKG